MVYARDREGAQMLRRLKGVFDPAGILDAREVVLPMKIPSLDYFRHTMEQCNHCGQCKWIPAPQVARRRFGSVPKVTCDSASTPILARVF